MALGFDDGTIEVWSTQTGKRFQLFHTPKPYESMNITGVIGLTEAQKASLIALGAIELECQ